MICGGSPCQDFSVAGKQKGSIWKCESCGYEYNPIEVFWSFRPYCPKCYGSSIDKTRSSLLIEFLRFVRYHKPDFGIYENVKNIVGKKFIDTFKLFLKELEMYGYNVYWKVLNAKDYGVPQNRERVYVVFIKKNLDNQKFKFPEGFDNGIRLKDLLERDDEVLEKYFLSDDVQRRLQITDPKFKKNIVDTTIGKDCTRFGQRDLVYQKECIIGTLNATDYKQPKQILETTNKPIHIADLCSEKFQRMHEQSRRVYSEDGIAPAMHTCGGGNTEPKVERGNLRIIRKLTPKECFRLMGFDDYSYEAASSVVSNTDKGIVCMIQTQSQCV